MEGQGLRMIADGSSENRRFRLLGLCVGLIISVAFAVVVVAAVFGLSRVDPRNTGWINGDFYAAYLAWENFRLEPGPAYRLQTSRLSTPLPLDIVMFGPVPFEVLVMKMLSPYLPTPGQTIGGVIVLNAILQSIFAFLMFRDLARRYHPELAATVFAVIAMTFVAASPVLIFRWLGHLTLTGHWPILAAIWIYFRVDRASVASTLASFALLFAALGSISGYLCVMVALLYAGVIARWVLSGEMTARRALACVLPPLTGLASLAAFGSLALGAGGFLPAEGYGAYSANLLSLFDPNQWGAVFMPRLPTRHAQYEGYSYLGVGAILMICVASIVAARAKTLWTRDAIVLGIVGMAAFLLSLSTIVTFGTTTLLQVPVPGPLYDLLEIFRASGRFIWIPYYLLIIGSALILARYLPGRRLIAAMAAFALVQAVDLAPTWAALRASIARLETPRLKSDQWNDLGTAHRALLVVPPWACGAATTPGGHFGFAMLGGVALRNGLVTNNFYTGRVPRDQWNHHCEYFAKRFEDVPIAPDAAYVLTDSAFTQKGLRLPATHFCEFADGVVLCRAGHPGVGPYLSQKLEGRLVWDGTALRAQDSGFARALGAGWDVGRQGAPVMNAPSADARFFSALRPDRDVELKLEVLSLSARATTLDVYVASFHAGAINLDERVGPTTTSLQLPAGLIPLGRAFGVTLVDRDHQQARTTLISDDRIELLGLAFATLDGVASFTSAEFVFNSATRDRTLLGEGWSYLEGWGVWNDGHHAIMKIPNIAAGRLSQVDFKVEVFASPGHGLPQQMVQIYLDGQFMKTVNLDPGPASFQLQVPSSIASDKPALLLEMKFPAAASPARLSISGDSRVLAIGLKSVVLKAHDG
jgi:hypothetical protein